MTLDEKKANVEKLRNERQSMLAEQKRVYELSCRNIANEYDTAIHLIIQSEEPTDATEQWRYRHTPGSLGYSAS